MTKDDIFELYKKVQNKDRDAESQLIELHRKKFPNNSLHETSSRGSCSYSRNNLHIMYLHLTK